MSNSGLYKLVWQNGLFYIGQARDLLRRKREHFNRMQSGNHRNYKVQNAFALYGLPEFEIIEMCNSEELNIKEQAALDMCFGLPCCLNLSSKFSITETGYVHDDEAKKKIGQKSSQKVYTPEYRQKLREGQLRRVAEGRGWQGEKWSDEQKLKMSRQRKGLKKSAEHRAKIGAAHKGEKNYNYGGTMSEEAKKKASAKLSMHLNPKARKVINIHTGEIYLCAKEVSIKTNINYSSLTASLRRNKHELYRYAQP